MRREAYVWVYIRLSGVLLLFLVLGHMLLMHILVGVNHIDFAFVSGRWNGLGWRAYDLAMLLLAMPHAALGVRGLAFDHLRPAARAPSLGAGLAVCLVVTVLGAWVILTFPNPL
jgi:succinate dehydrogenase / fumarate reductase, membrane anchor subunit